MAAAAGLPPSIDFAINVRNVIGGNTFVACNRGAKKGLLPHEIPQSWLQCVTILRWRRRCRRILSRRP